MKRLALFLVLFLIGSVAMAQVAAYTGRALKRTVLLTVGNRASEAADTGCSESGCVAYADLFPARYVKCDADTGQTCTYAVQVETPIMLSAGDIAYLGCTVGGKIGPSLNAADAIAFTESGPASFTFLNQVKNSSPNQFHLVTCSIGCRDAGGDTGCTVFAQSSQMYHLGATERIDVFTP